MHQHLQMIRANLSIPAVILKGLDFIYSFSFFPPPASLQLNIIFGFCKGLFPFIASRWQAGDDIFLAEASASLTKGEIITLGETGSASVTSLRCQKQEHSVLSLWTFFFLRNLATSHAKRSQLAALLCCQQQGKGGGMRQGTALFPRLPQLLFNCLLIYLITAATRASGWAASMLFLKQLSALRLLVLDIPPSLLDLYQSTEQPFCVSIKEQQGAMGGVAGGGGGPGHKGSDKDQGWRSISRRIQFSDLNECLQCESCCLSDQHWAMAHPPPTLIKSCFFPL